MSDTRDHNTSTLISPDGRFIENPKPGDMVSFLYGATSLGMITEVLEDGNVCRVLWANYSNVFENVIRHVNINYGSGHHP